MCRLHPNADLNRIFWFAPIKKQSGDMDIWFKESAVGQGTLGNFVKSMMRAAGYSGTHKNYTNHSLRTTTVNRLIDAGLSDGDIMARTGHRSSTTIAKYRRVNDANCGATSQALCITPQSHTSTTAENHEMNEIMEILNTLDDDDFDDVPDIDTTPSRSGFDLGVTQLITAATTYQDASTQTWLV